MELTNDYVKDDPCYGCIFAVPKSDDEIANEGIFTRRFVCANSRRRTDMEYTIIRAITEHDYKEAMKVLSSLMDSISIGNGMMKVVEATITPFCYQRKN